MSTEIMYDILIDTWVYIVMIVMLAPEAGNFRIQVVNLDPEDS
jgi:hypothetical protein